MDEILHTPREESSAIRPPLAQLRDRWEAGTAALAQRVEPLRRRLDAATAGGRRLINPLHFLAAAVVIGVAAVVGTVYTPSYVVEVDGVAVVDEEKCVACGKCARRKTRRHCRHMSISIRPIARTLI